MRRLIFICLTATMLLLATSCSLSDDSPNFHFKPLQITGADLPDSFDLNESYQITVNYTLPDDCSTFSGFDVTDVDTAIRKVVIFGTVRTDRETCITLATEAQATFDFICLYDEPYTFRFWNGEGTDGEQEYLEVVVPVN